MVLCSDSTGGRGLQAAQLAVGGLCNLRLVALLLLYRQTIKVQLNTQNQVQAQRHNPARHQCLVPNFWSLIFCTLVRL